MGFFANLFGLGKKSDSCCGCSCFDEHKSAFTDLDIHPDHKEVLKNIDPLIKVGKVMELGQHPDPKMTKVRVSMVSFGDDELHQILCGGINLEIGQIVPVATIGTMLDEDFEITKRAIRGVESSGMICAREELGIPKAEGEKPHEIWVFPEDLEEYLGQSLRDLV